MFANYIKKTGDPFKVHYIFMTYKMILYSVDVTKVLYTYYKYYFLNILMLKDYSMYPKQNKIVKSILWTIPFKRNALHDITQQNVHFSIDINVNARP